MNAARRTRAGGKRSRANTRTLTSYAGISALLASVGILAGTALIYWLILLPSNTIAHDRFRQNTALAYAEVINSRAQLLTGQTAYLAQSPGVIAALGAAAHGAGTTVDLRAIEAQLTPPLAGVRGIRIFARGTARSDTDVSPPVNFAAVDLISKVESARPVAPEAHRVGTAILVYAAAAVRDAASGDVIGSVLLVADGEYIEEALHGIDPRGGLIRLEQRFDKNNPVALFEYGKPSAQVVLEIDTDVPHWILVYQPSSEALLAAGISAASLLPALAMVLIGVVGGIFFGYHRMHREVEADLVAIRDNADRLLRQRGPLPAMNLGFMNRLVQMLQAAGGTTSEELQGPTAEPSPRIQPALAKSKPPTAPQETVAEEAVELPLELDDDFLDIEDDTDTVAATPPESTDDSDMTELTLDPTIFRSYDVRGIIGRNFGEEVVYLIGKALAAEAVAVGVKTLVVGGDARASSPALRKAVARGIVDSGLEVIDIGQVPTPLLYFATHLFRTGSGVMITGSHNPPDYNGMKMMLAGETLAEERIQALRERIEANDFVRGKGTQRSENVVQRYMERIIDDVTIARSLKVVVDCGNGVAGAIAPALLRALGCDVIELFCDVDGSFPNHHPDPAVPENLRDLIGAVREHSADIGIAFDGDGDRLGAVTDTGRIIWPDRLMMLFARDIVGRNPGSDVVFDVKCSRHLGHVVSEYGGRPIMWKTGHSHIKAKVKETGALLGGEFSGHICFAERWYGFDDALYSAARLLEVVGAETESVDEIFAQIPNPLSTPEIKIEVGEENKFNIITEVAANGEFDGGTMNNIDGVRIDFTDGWGLVRASNTSPVLTLRFEGDSDAALQRIASLFQRELGKVDPAIQFSLH